eukprot:1576057-Heterocapsa_arctica.AAC.1
MIGVGENSQPTCVGTAAADVIEAFKRTELTAVQLRVMTDLQSAMAASPEGGPERFRIHGGGNCAREEYGRAVASGGNLADP